VLVPAKVANEALLAERRGKIVSAAVELMLHQGFHQTSVREIAAAAGVTMGTLYLYISRKEDVLYLASEAIMTELSDGLLGVERRESAVESLRDAARYFFGAVSRLRREVALLYRESASLLPEHLEVMKQAELRERDFLAAIVRDGIASGEFRPLDPELLAHDVIMLAHMWALKGWALRERFDEAGYFDAQFNVILSNLLEERVPSNGRSEA
jgi:AcrR family transcriptional regulator